MMYLFPPWSAFYSLIRFCHWLLIRFYLLYVLRVTRFVIFATFPTFLAKSIIPSPSKHPAALFPQLALLCSLSPAVQPPLDSCSGLPLPILPFLVLHVSLLCPVSLFVLLPSPDFKILPLQELFLLPFFSCNVFHTLDIQYISLVIESWLYVDFPLLIGWARHFSDKFHMLWKPEKSDDFFFHVETPGPFCLNFW